MLILFIMRITIIYDNEINKEGLIPDWGFACLVEYENSPKILFDTGADGKILISNMRNLHIDPETIDEVFISHNHWDHTGGIKELLRINPDVKLIIPPSVERTVRDTNYKLIEDLSEIHTGIYSTGELAGIEQSMITGVKDGVIVVVGCSHPGVDIILNSASKIGTVKGIIGGFHGFNKFDALKDIELICPCHCTQYKSKIHELYPDKTTKCGAGLELSFT